MHYTPNFIASESLFCFFFSPIFLNRSNVHGASASALTSDANPCLCVDLALRWKHGRKRAGGAGDQGRIHSLFSQIAQSFHRLRLRGGQPWPCWSSSSVHLRPRRSPSSAIELQRSSGCKSSWGRVDVRAVATACEVEWGYRHASRPWKNRTACERPAPTPTVKRLRDTKPLSR
jgi:hypothetical protein